MIITASSLQALRVGFQSSFQGALDQAQSRRTQIATTVPSSTKEETYGWLNKMPGMREWVGPRIAKSVSESSYTIKNKDWEDTVDVDRNDIEDDTLGVYSVLFESLGEAVGAHPDQLVFNALKNGFTTNCYDGQPFFNTNHPYVDENGVTQVAANTDGGAGTPWFLLCTKKKLKPIIFQERKKPQFVAKDKVTDDNVFDLKQFKYGVDGRWNVGYGFWQMAWGSKQTLNAANYEIARAAIAGFKGDNGRPLGLVPDLLVVPPSLEGAARRVLKTQVGAAGATNEWEGSADLLMSPWLA